MCVCVSVMLVCVCVCVGDVGVCVGGVCGWCVWVVCTCMCVYMFGTTNKY